MRGGRPKRASHAWRDRVRAALPFALHFLGPVVLALVGGWVGAWTLWQVLAFAYSLTLLTHFVLRLAQAELLTVLDNAYTGLAVLALFCGLIWWSFFATGHGDFTFFPALGAGGGPDLHVRFASLTIVVAAAVPYAVETVLRLFGLRDD